MFLTTANHPAVPQNPICSLSLLSFYAPSCSKCLLFKEKLVTYCVNFCREPFNVDCCNFLQEYTNNYNN